MVYTMYLLPCPIQGLHPSVADPYHELHPRDDCNDFLHHVVQPDVYSPGILTPVLSPGPVLDSPASAL
jgi:hypothetical protein